MGRSRVMKPVPLATRVWTNWVMAKNAKMEKHYCSKRPWAKAQKRAPQRPLSRVFQHLCGHLRFARVGQVFDGAVMVLLQLVFVFHDLAVELVHQGVNRGIQILRTTLYIDGFTG